MRVDVDIIPSYKLISIYNFCMAAEYLVDKYSELSEFKPTLEYLNDVLDYKNVVKFLGDKYPMDLHTFNDVINKIHEIHKKCNEIVPQEKIEKLNRIHVNIGIALNKLNNDVEEMAFALLSLKRDINRYFKYDCDRCDCDRCDCDCDCD